MEQTLTDLIEHQSWISAHATLAETSDAFRGHDWEFMAVLDEGEFIGLCSRSDVADMLGNRYGFALNQSKPITTFLRAEALQLMAQVSLNHAFERVFSRDLAYFYDDVVVLDAGGVFRGLIRTHALIRLQHHVHRESISLLKRQAQEIEHRNQRMLEDLSLCSEMQRALFPVSLPGSLWEGRGSPTPEPSLGYVYHPHAVVGGDFFHWCQWTDQSMGLLVADVMGHDLRAALVTTMMKALFDELASADRRPDDVLQHMNRRLTKSLGSRPDALVYVTACYVRIDPVHRRVSAASAGHPMPLLIPSATSKPPVFMDDQGRGTVLGVFDDAVFQTIDLELSPQDRLFLYTDGIYEIEGRSGVFWGVEGLLRAVSAHRHLGVSDLLTRVVSEARSHALHGQFQDDVCLICVDPSEIETVP